MSKKTHSIAQLPKRLTPRRHSPHLLLMSMFMLALTPLRAADCAGVVYIFLIAPIESTQGSGGTVNKDSPEGKALMIATVASSVGVSLYGSYLGINNDLERREKVLHWIQQDSKGLRRELLTQSGERYQWLLKHFTSFQHTDELPVASCALRHSSKEIKRIFKYRSYVKRRDQLLALLNQLNQMIYQLPSKECSQLRDRIKKSRHSKKGS